MQKQPTIFAATLSLLVLVSCSQSANNSAPPAAAAGETKAAHTATLPDGLVVTLEMAIDDETRAQGLMFRESLAPGRGMLFLFPEESTHSFWMKNTLIPLDMIWLDRSGIVVEVQTNVPPCPKGVDPCPSYGGTKIAASVLELAAGEASRHQVTVGSTIKLTGVSDLAVR